MSAATPPLPPGGPARGPGPTQGVGPAGPGRAASLRDGAAFRALLEQLEQRAGALEQKSRTELESEELAEAVGEARASMQDALELQRELLEAWRQARQLEGGTGAESDEGSGQ